MKLIASCSGLDRYNEALATIDVESDTAEESGDVVRRRIEGRIVSKGSIWDAYMDMCHQDCSHHRNRREELFRCEWPTGGPRLLRKLHRDCFGGEPNFDGTDGN